MKRMLFLWAGMYLFMLPANSQLPYAISGIVTDETGQPMPGTSVLLQPGGQGTVTGLEGRYSFTGLPPGSYAIIVSFMGYEKRTDTLMLESNIRWDIRMTPSRQNLEEVVITGDYAALRKKEESLTMEIVNDAYLRQNLSGSLMQSLDRLPGVDAIGIGSGQSKPVIRGLSFNRVVVVENGIKHEGQQWGNDHGLEIDQYAVDRVEVIKGPSSLLYGSDAIGGVILLNQSAAPERDTWGGSADFTGNTNNNLLGGSLRFFLRKDKGYFSFRGTYLDHGDFRVPADSVDIYSYRAPLHRNHLRNTAGKEGTFHLETGWIHNGFSSRLFISRLENRNGFFANAHGLEPRRVDNELHDRSSRDIQYPFHRVNHWKAINRTSWMRENHTFEIEMGLQRNYRQEWSQYVSHGYMPPIYPDTLPFPSDLERQFEKFIYSGNIRSTYRTNRNLQIISGIQSELQDNRINGRGFIIPEFDQSRLGVFLVLKQEITANSLISGGLRYDFGGINTDTYHDWFPSPVVIGPDTVQVYVRRSEALNRRFSNLTWTLGYNLDHERFSFKVNLGKSFRMPLAKELAANGVNYHRFSYEVGDSALSPETAYQLDAGWEWHTRLFAIGISPFIGYFPNYIYLNPGYEHDRLYGGGNQIYIFTQSEVLRHGGELRTHYQPFPSFRVGMIGEYTYSLQLTGQKEGFGLPFTPPASLLLNLKYSSDRIWYLHEPYALLDFRLVSAQRRIVPPEEPTPGYRVVHLGIGGNMRFRQQVVSVGIQIQNLLNRKYFDHTSYYRLVNIPEPGRSFVINVSIPFSGHLSKNKESINP